MTPKKEKKKSKNKAESNQKADIGKQVYNFHSNHNFQLLIPEMIYSAVQAKSKDPVRCFIDYLLQQKGSNLKEYANEELKKRLKEQQKAIEELNIKIQAHERDLQHNDTISMTESNLIGTQTISNFLLDVNLSNLTALDYDCLETQVATQHVQNKIEEAEKLSQASDNFSLSGNLVIDESKDKDEMEPTEMNSKKHAAEPCAHSQETAIDTKENKAVEDVQEERIGADLSHEQLTGNVNLSVELFGNEETIETSTQPIEAIKLGKDSVDVCDEKVEEIPVESEETTEIACLPMEPEEETISTEPWESDGDSNEIPERTSFEKYNADDFEPDFEPES